MQTWNLRLFGTLRVSRGEEEFFRFSTRKTGSLLAFLAFHSDQRHSRELLCDLLWPDEPPQTGRARLRVALTSLRHQLEPPGIVPGSVICSEGNEQIRLVANAVATDVAEVERSLLILNGASGSALDDQIAAAQRLTANFQEPLLTGFYENWVITERERLNQIAVERLSALSRQVPLDVGVELARHAARIDSTSEEALLALFPLLKASGQHTDVRRMFQAYCRHLKTLGVSPSPELRALAANVSAGRGMVSSAPPAEKVLLSPLPTGTAPLITFPRRLPLYLTRFFGREAERQELRLALAETSLVTLTGPGGTGKTRLAVETARTWDGAGFFVPLADTLDPSQIPAAICDALGETAKSIKGSGDALLARAADVLTKAVAPLLILDNLEQIADSAGSLLLMLVERVPTLRVLVTSRLRIHLPGEREFPLSPLPLPPPPQPPFAKDSLEGTARIPSVALFLDRARAARPDFQITTRNGEDVVTVCRMLEGNPLAIELVAARGGTLVPSQMREKLGVSGHLRIASRRAGVDDRHHSLHNAIDWSYQLLPLNLRRFFARLSVFRGGFTADAAAVVCESEGENVAGEAIARLRAHSLIGSVAGDSQMRFSLLESLRTFGLEQLTDDEREAARERHATYFTEFAERSFIELRGEHQAAWIEAFDAEIPNLYVTIERDLVSNPHRALQVAGALSDYWDLRGKPTEGRRYLERALAACPADTPHRSRALRGAGTLALMQGESVAAQPFFAQSLSLCRRTGDAVGVAAALLDLGLIALSRREWNTSHDYFNESLAVRRAATPPMDISSCVLNMGVIAWECGDVAASSQCFAEVLNLYQEQSDLIGEARVLNNLGVNALSVNHFAEAEARFEQSLTIKRLLGNKRGIASTLSNVGVAAMYQGYYARAWAYFEECVAIYREMDAPIDVSYELRNLAQIAIYRREWDNAAALLRESLTLVRGSDAPGDIDGILECFALFAEARGEPEHAAYLFGAADSIRIKAGCPLHPAERVAVDKAIAGARQVLGDEKFDQKFREGAANSLDAVVKAAYASLP